MDAASGRFTVTFTGNPPSVATFALSNGGHVGVGFPVLVRGADAVEGRVTDQGLYTRALGAAGQHAVIYVEGTLPSEVGWTNMRQGYNVGRGVPAKAGDTFDTFVAVSASTIELVVDALKNIEVVNWS